MMFPEHTKKAVIEKITSHVLAKVLEDFLDKIGVVRENNAHMISTYMEIREDRLTKEREAMEDLVRKGDEARALLGLPPVALVPTAPLGTILKPPVGAHQVTVVTPKEDEVETDPTLLKIIEQETENKQLDKPKGEQIPKEKHPEVKTKFGTRLSAP